jgi:16S rRNA (cytosine1402-N4)-methyltransferase
MKRRRSTTPGEHRAVLLDEVLAALAPRPGEIAVDVTCGWAGHSAAILERLGPEGKLIALDWDADNLPAARERLDAVGHPFRLVHSNFAGLPQVLLAEGIDKIDCLVADLGMSSMQVDDAERGFSYRRDGPLDMRMDRSRGRTAAQLLQTISEQDLAHALAELGDEPQAETIARAIVRDRAAKPLERTSELAALVQEATGQRNWRLTPRPGTWQTHPAARTFQALRLLVNRELANLTQLLRVLPELLNAGGRAAIISFHSGEDRLAKTAFRDGKRRGIYAKAPDCVRPQYAEIRDNPRARSAKLRWAIRATPLAS